MTLCQTFSLSWEDHNISLSIKKTYHIHEFSFYLDNIKMKQLGNNPHHTPLIRVGQGPGGDRNQVWNRRSWDRDH